MLIGKNLVYEVGQLVYVFPKESNILIIAGGAGGGGALLIIIIIIIVICVCRRKHKQDNDKPDKQELTEVVEKKEESKPPLPRQSEAEIVRQPSTQCENKTFKPADDTNAVVNGNGGNIYTKDSTTTKKPDKPPIKADKPVVRTSVAQKTNSPKTTTQVPASSSRNATPRVSEAVNEDEESETGEQEDLYVNYASPPGIKKAGNEGVQPGRLSKAFNWGVKNPGVIRQTSHESAGPDEGLYENTSFANDYFNAHGANQAQRNYQGYPSVAEEGGEGGGDQDLYANSDAFSQAFQGPRQSEHIYGNVPRQ